MSIAYDRALLAKQCEDIIKTAERVDANLSWFDFVGHFMIRRLIHWATLVLEDNEEC